MSSADCMWLCKSWISLQLYILHRPFVNAIYNMATVRKHSMAKSLMQIMSKWSQACETWHRLNIHITKLYLQTGNLNVKWNLDVVSDETKSFQNLHFTKVRYKSNKVTKRYSCRTINIYKWNPSGELRFGGRFCCPAITKNNQLLFHNILARRIFTDAVSAV